MKKVWIFSHYGTSELVGNNGRHYDIAKYLKEEGYEPVVFVASTIHRTTNHIINFKDEKYKTLLAQTNVPYVIINTRSYLGNGKNRILNMYDFYHNIISNYKNFIKQFGKPDVIIGSSVHPLSAYAAIKVGKKIKCKKIVEILDLWPESIVAYNVAKPNNPIIQLLYKFEKYLYKSADLVVMSWPGGYDYILNKGWGKSIPKDKVIHISMGVDLELFKNNLLNNKFEDADLTSKEYFKIIYTGAIAKVNNLNILVETAKLLKEKGINKAKFIIYGAGSELETLKELVVELGLDNIIFKGSVEKKYIPYILSNADLTILHNTSTSLNVYGQSQKKFFEYMASGKPILMTYSVGHSIIKNNSCGIELESQTPENIMNSIVKFINMLQEEYDSYCENVQNTVKQYDNKNLAHKYMEIL